jgi:hypothetical protein
MSKMSGQQLNLRIKGLYTSANELSANPEGALSVADDVVIDFESLAQSRRGFHRLAFEFNDTANRANRYTSYKSTLLCQNGASTLSRYDSMTGWVDYSGTYAHPDADMARIRFLQANSNLYFTTSAGVYKLDTATATPRTAGGLKALDAAATTSGATGFMPDNSQIAYRILWGYKDANNNLILGTVSNRAIVSNSSGGTVDVSVSFTIPDAATTSDFYQIYRSAASASSTTEPTDEMQLVYEANPTSGQISAGTVTVVDIVPDALKGATLYTSPSEGGIVSNNEPPPFCNDFCTYRGYTFYANTRSSQRLFLTVIAVGGTDGIAVNDTITIDGVVYTAKNAETIASGFFKLFTGGTPAQNIADTCASLVRVINRYASNTTVNAFYISGYNELPGQILLEARAAGTSAFVVTASAHTTAYRPNLPTSGTTVSSTNDQFQNAIYYSKELQPEAVPLTNVFFAGSREAAILRILPLRDSVFVLKTDGIFRITGSSPVNFLLEPFDLTTQLLAPDSAVVLSNEIWMYSDQGIVSVSDSGVQVRSRPIDAELNRIKGQALSQIKEKSFSIGYETDRKYVFFTVSASTDDYPVQAFVFNLFTNTWVRWARRQSAGFVNPVDDKLYLGDADEAFTNIERKDYLYTDYIDELVVTTTLSAYDTSSLVITLAALPADVEVGDLLYQSATVTAVITDVDLENLQVTINANVAFVVGAVSVYKGIKGIIEWQPLVAGNPGRVKQWPEVSALFKATRFFRALFRFRSELSQALTSVAVDGTNPGGWGLFPWGSVPWGGTAQAKAIRTFIPGPKQYAAQLVVRIEIKSGYSDWKILGVSVPYNDISFEVTK